MKKTISLMLIAVCSLCYAQEKEQSSEKNFFGVQAGLLGTNVYNEYNLSKKFALRTDFNLEASFFSRGDLTSKSGFALVPDISVTPKWYYNITKRDQEGKNTRHNAANYISARVGFIPDWFVISNIDGLYTNPMIYVAPTWGFRRNFARNFNYEFQVGMGVGKILKDDYPLQAVPNLSFRIGYDF